MIITVGSLITLAMDTIGAVNLDETPTNAELTNGMARANIMIDAWSADNLMLLAIIMESFPLVAGTAQYTIGPTGTFKTSVPTKIDTAFIRDGNLLDTDVTVISEDEYYSYPDIAYSTARPEALFLDLGPTQQGSPLAVINLYPIPDSSQPYTLWIGEEKPLTEFVNITDTVSFQPAYYEALLYNLATRMYRSFNKHSKPIPPDILQLAKESKATIERMNHQRLHLMCDLPGSKTGTSAYNILTDEGA